MQLGAVEVYNGAGPATAFITKDGLAPGTYYIKIQSYSTTEFANYKVSDTLFTAPLVNDAEPNNARATAIALPVNNSTTGHVGYYYNNLRDTTDWYKVTTTADGLLRVYLTTSLGSTNSTTGTDPLDVNVTLYDNNGATQLGAVEVFNGNGSASGLITKDGLQPGTYYIKVQNYSTGEFANYKLTDSLFVPQITADPEPNGTTATATVFAPNSSVKGHVGYYYNSQSDSADFYKLTTLTAGPLHFYLTSSRGSIYSTNPLDLLLNVYSGNGTTLLGTKEIYNGGNPASDSLVFTNLAAGTYYVKIQSYSTTEFADYSLINSAIAAGPLPVTSYKFRRAPGW